MDTMNLDTMNLDDEALNDAIAVIGMSCRFPGAASLDEYWHNLCSGKVSVSFLGQDELASAGVAADLLSDPSYVPAAYRLRNIDMFDAAFFGYAGSEAETIDPQQRFFLECAWESLEDAGYSPLPGGGLEGKNVGVFGGSRISTYLSHVYKGLHPGGSAHAFQCLVGNDKDYLCSRVSYKLNLHGPSLGVQSACSSSLAAVHIACENLRSGACDMALAGGVAVDAGQNRGYLYQDGMIFSPDGYCRPFDKEASGTVFSGGCGVVVLKRLEDALRDGDAVYAAILASVVNNDGAQRVGYTAPGELGQTMVISEAVSLSGLSARNIGYIETHGTGTAIGDPIEFAALRKVFGHFTNDRGFCALGAVKANIGHADAASGIASFIKAVMAVHTGTLPPHPLFHEANSAVDLENSPFYINTDLCPWKDQKKPRAAGISSFGIGGSNAHVVICQAPAKPQAAHNAATNTAQEDLFTLSSRTEDMLRTFAGRMADCLQAHADWSLKDVCCTARSAFSSDKVRLCLCAASLDELTAGLREFAQGSTPAGLSWRKQDASQAGTCASPSIIPAQAADDYLAGKKHALDALQAKALSLGAARVHLPSTPFARKRCWPADDTASDKVRRAVQHPVWRSRTATADSLLYEGILSGQHLERMLDHVVSGRSLAPASLYMELLHAACLLEYGGPRSILDLAVLKPLILTKGKDVFFQLVMNTAVPGRTKQAEEESSADLAVYASADPQQAASWQRVAQARLGSACHIKAELDSPLPQEDEWTNAGGHYAAMHVLGMEYGPAFQCVQGVCRRSGRAWLKAAGPNSGWQWDPALLDACLQGVTDCIPEDLQQEKHLFVPAGLKRLSLSPKAAKSMRVLLELAADDQNAGIKSSLKEADAEHFLVDVTMLDADGQAAGRIEGLIMHRLELSENTAPERLSLAAADGCCKVGWIEKALQPGTEKLSGSWLVLADEGAVKSLLSARIKEAGLPHAFLEYARRTHLPEEVQAVVSGSGEAHIVFAWGLSETVEAKDFYGRTVHSLLDLVKLLSACLRDGEAGRIHLHLLTSHAFGPENACTGPNSALQKPGQSLLWGFASVLHQEHPKLRVQVLDLGSAKADPFLVRALAEPGSGDCSRELFRALRGTRFFVPRLLPYAHSHMEPAKPAALAADGRGLDCLHWKPLERRKPDRGEVEVALAASSLNFRDVLMAMGIYPGAVTALGSDGAGIVTAVGADVEKVRPGDRVAVSAYGCLATHVIVPSAMVCRIPDAMLLEEAAGLPVAYITASYGLESLARLKEGQTVLIHAASGGVGMAAMAVCKKIGARIFATAGSEEKRELVRNMGAELVMDSRSELFAGQVLEATANQGVDAVLNSLAGDLQKLSLGLVRDGGTFVELGKSGVMPEGELETARGRIRYCPVDLYELSLHSPETMAQVFAHAMDCIANGSVPALPVRVFAAGEYNKAFQFMMQARHTGKIVLRWPDSPDPAAGSMQGTALISGGLGGLGLRLAKYLAGQGGSRLVLLARRTPSQAEEAVLNEIRDMGAEVRLALADVSDYDAMHRAVLDALCGMPPLRHIYHLAGSLSEAVILKQDAQTFDKSLAPKVQGGWNLHRLSLEMQDTVKSFVLFSSTAALLGPISQVNYAAANAWLDELALYRRRLNLPALSINWGAFAGTGMAHRSSNLDFLALLGIGAMQPETGFALMQKLLEQGASRAMAACMDWGKYQKALSRDQIPALLDSVLAGQQEAAHKKSSPKTAVPPEGTKAPARKRDPDTAGAVKAAIRRRAAAILRSSADDLDGDANLMELGIDSLLALDLFQYLEKEFQIHVERSLLFSNPSINALSAQVSAMLAEETKGRADGMPVMSPDPSSRYEEFPLMDMQQAYWVGRTGALVLGNVSCHVYLELDMENLDCARFEDSWNRLIRRHDMLRCVMLENGRQRILQEVPHFSIPVTDCTGMEEAARQTVLDKTRLSMADEVLPASRWPLFSVSVTRLSGTTSRLHISLDLLIADLHSMNLMMRDLESFYLHPETKLQPLEITFRDYVLAQGSVQESARWQEDREYWKKRLPLLAGAPDLPLAKSPSQISRPHFVRHAARLDKELWSALRRKAAARDLTVSGLLMACYAEILARWSSRESFTINVTLFNRLPLHPQVSDIVGDFTSVSLLGVNHDSAASFLERAKALQQQLWADMDHSLFPGVEVIREWSRHTNRKSSDIIPIVFTSTIGFGDEHGTHPALHTFGTMVYSITQTPQVWIDHQVREVDGCLDYNWDAVDELFPAGLVDDMFSSYSRLLTMLAADDRIWHCTRLPLLPEAQLERRRSANATHRDFAGLGRRTLDDFFVRSLVRNPGSTALIDGGLSLTYAELGSLAEKLCQKLLSHGVRAGSLVPVVTDGGWQECCAALAAASAGACYVPIDAHVPAARLKHLLDITGSHLVLTQDRHLSLMWPAGLEVLPIEDLTGDPKLKKTVDFDVERKLSKPQNLAYIIHTSGSTGAPKGVMIRHECACNTIQAVNELTGLTSADRVLALSRFTFDLSVWDIFGLLAAGGALVVPDPARRLEAGHWLDLCAEHSVTIWNSVPPLMQILTGWLEQHSPRMLPPLRCALLSGDRIPLSLPDRVHALWPNLSLFSLGGATEASIWSNYFPIGQLSADWKSIPYGRPLANQRFYILKKDGTDCPDNVPGELYIAGGGLADGYLKDAARTAERFVRHPGTGEALYATGDLGCWHPSGQMEFLGRLDSLVKINGYRVELGEVENTLLAHPQVGQAAALAIKGHRAGQMLAAFAAPKPGTGQLAAEELKSWLADRLPSFLVPGILAVRDHLPLTASGKVDRLQLAAEPQELESAAGSGTKPCTKTEEIMAQAIGEVLKAPAVSIDSRFFEMGLSSLDLVTVQSMLEDRLHQTVPLMTLLEHTTIRSLAAWADSRAKPAASKTQETGKQNPEGTRACSRGMERAKRRLANRARKETQPRQ